MRALVVYESMYGNTHTVANRIAEGLRSAGNAEVDCVSVHEVTREQVAAADLLVVGGPTHAHAMTSGTTRASAREAAEKPGSDLTLEPDTEGSGLRDWFLTIGALAERPAAAFDTRANGPAVFTGRASKGIARRLTEHGCALVCPPESFLVDRHNHLLEGEDLRAEEWGEAVVGARVAQG